MIDPSPGFDRTSIYGLVALGFLVWKKDARRLAEVQARKEKNKNSSFDAEMNQSEKRVTKTMTITLYAQPYDISASGFYFKSEEEFQTQSKGLRNEYGEPVEEYEIQFIDGDQIDCELAQAFELNQITFANFLEIAEQWDKHQKTCFIIANGECGYGFNPKHENIETLEIDMYQVDNLKELAEQFVEEGLYGDIPKALEHYLDHEAMARDLSADYSMTEIAGNRLACRCM